MVSPSSPLFQSSKFGFLLPTLTVDIQGGRGEGSVRCMLDLASQRSYISESVVRGLGIDLSKLQSYTCQIKTFIGTKQKQVREVNLSVNLNNQTEVIPFIIEENLNLDFEVSNLAKAIQNIKIAGFKLADREFDQLSGDKVHNLKALIGVDVLQHFKFWTVPCLGGAALETQRGIIPFGSIVGFTNPAQAHFNRRGEVFNDQREKTTPFCEKSHCSTTNPLGDQSGKNTSSCESDFKHFKSVSSSDGGRPDSYAISNNVKIKNFSHLNDASNDHTLSQTFTKSFIQGSEDKECLGSVRATSGLGSNRELEVDTPVISKFDKGRELSNDDCVVVNAILNPIKSYFNPLNLGNKEPDLDLGLEYIYSLESIGITESNGSLDEVMIKNFNKLIEIRNNRYFIELPWYKEILDKVPSNHRIALATLNRVCNYLQNKDLYSKYDEVFQNQLEDEILEQIIVDPSDYDKYTWIPHRPIIKEASQVTTKIRPVFNCSLKVQDYPSLNEASYPGVDLMASLFSLLCRFRSNKFVLISDIKQAFLQIKLKLESDRNRFCLFWYKNNKLVTYRYTTIVFGLAASPFILNYVLKHLIGGFPSDFVSHSLLSSFYVDNFIFTNSDIDTLLNIYRVSKERMLSGGFELRSWNSNNLELKQKFVEENDAEEHGTGVERVLGYQYNVEEDTIQLMNFDFGEFSYTKRKILSQVSKVFDPLSLFLPVTIRGRLLIQSLWSLGMGWDVVIDDLKQREWNLIAKDLNSLKEFKFDRFAFDEDNDTSLKIFCDASKACYGFAIYAVSYGKSNLIFSKAKVAPLKGRTLPTLELLSVFLAVKVLPQFLSSFDFKFESIEIFVDAQIVLSWILSKDFMKNKSVFVKNRLQDIHMMSEKITKDYGISPTFNYVNTNENPSDLVTRGISIKEFKNNLDLWLHGPTWLGLPSNCWPQSELKCVSDENKSKIKSVQTSVAIQSDKVVPILSIDKFSSLSKLYRITAYVLKFVFKLKRKVIDNDYATKLYWLYIMQLESFPNENDFLEKDKESNKPVPDLVKNLDLFLDDVGLIRSRGRIAKSNYYDENVVNPILLGKAHPLTKLIIWDCHLKCKHLGLQSTLNMLRTQGYWVTSPRQTVKGVISDCMICKKFNQFAFQYPKFTQFTKAQVNLFRPYKHVGVDYTSHLFVKNEDGTSSKYYILLFTCLNIRAVHIELVPDMSAKAFLMAFQRFSNLYGVCEVIYSDNAKTFLIGGKAIEESLNSNEFEEHMRCNNIIHKTLPLYSPWMGAAWERLIRVIKSCLYKSIGRAKLSYFDLLTLLSNIQNSINSRPLTYMSADKDIVPLTPNTFLKIHSNSSVAIKMSDDDPLWSQSTPAHEKLNESCRIISEKFNHFRTIWYESYLLGLREYSRDLFQSDWVNRVKIGDVVLIKSPNKIRPFWKMGKILRLYTGNDNRIRSVQIKRGDGQILNYPINLLFPLEISVSHSGNTVTSNVPNNKNKITESSVDLDSSNGSSSRPKRAAAIKALQAISSINDPDI